MPEIADAMAGWFARNIDRAAFRLELKKGPDGSEQLLWHGWENKEPVVFTHDPHVGFWRRFAVGFMSWWPIESQL